MGRVYCGPYAEHIGYEHEGYAARVLPGGELTASWTAATEEFIAHVAACACGWTGDRHAPTDEGEEIALEEWDREHLQELIAKAAWEGWRAWAAGTASAAAEVAAFATAGRPERAAEVMRGLVARAQSWERTLDQLVEERAAATRGER